MNNVTVANLMALKASVQISYHHAFYLTSRTVKYSQDDYFPERLSTYAKTYFIITQRSTIDAEM